jgi:ABC-type glycerol-3-phosphate transport system substrate-binding protein
MDRRVIRRHVLAAGAKLLSGAALASCGGQPASAPAAKPAGPVSGAIELLWSTEQVTQDFLEKDWIPNFKKENPQADVALTVVPGSWPELFQKIQVTSAAGTPPSLSRGKDYFTGDMARQGLVEPLGGPSRHPGPAYPRAPGTRLARPSAPTPAPAEPTARRSPFSSPGGAP